jgi:Skp family chaperone for outer membrane proteins
MSNRLAPVVLALAVLATSACSNAPTGDIGLVDVQRIVANWPKFNNYQNQLNADVATIQQSRASDAVKRRQMEDIQRRFAANQTELTGDVRSAATQVAGEKHLRLVFTRQFVGYGGVDITPDVEKILHIEEKTPAP